MERKKAPRWELPAYFQISNRCVGHRWKFLPSKKTDTEMDFFLLSFHRSNLLHPFFSRRKVHFGFGPQTRKVSASLSLSLSSWQPWSKKSRLLRRWHIGPKVLGYLGNPWERLRVDRGRDPLASQLTYRTAIPMPDICSTCPSCVQLHPISFAFFPLPKVLMNLGKIVCEDFHASSLALS